MKERLVFSKPNDDGVYTPPQSPEEERERLLNKQEAALVGLARKFLDENKTAEALALVKNSKGFNGGNLVTLIGVNIQDPSDFGEEAKSYYAEYIRRANNFAELMPVLRYIKNPKRYFLPNVFSELTETRMRELNSEWDGTVDNSPMDQMNEKRKLFKLPIESITDPEVCLDLASIGKPSQKKRYLSRFLELGGSSENEKYIKIKLNAILLGIEKSEDPRSLVVQLSKQMPTHLYRKWIRDNTRKGSIDGWLRIPANFSRTVLATYISANPELDSTDWRYIAERSVELQEATLQRACFENLKQMSRNTDTQKIFDVLVRKFAQDEREGVSLADKQLTNPIYEQLPRRVPVNKAAAMTVARWAQDILNE